MNGPKISVIIPVYNAEPYLSRCLDSVIDQTYGNLEILLVDDGSSDASPRICDEYAAKDGRVKVIHAENRGAYAARNTALDTASGEYIAFADADDWLEPGMYETLLGLILEHNADIAQCELVNDGPYAQIRTTVLGRVTVYERDCFVRAVFREEIGLGLPGKLFKAEVWRGMRFAARHYHEDAVTISKIEDFCRRLVRTDQALYHYNTTNTSITRGKKRPLHISSLENLFDAFSSVARRGDPEGSFYICREIPSAGRLIPPSKEISVSAAIRHVRYMHRIFAKHWLTAKTADGYQAAPRAKKLLWHIYRLSPVTGSFLVALYARITG